MASCCDPYEDRYEERWRRGALSTLTCGTAWLAGFALASLGMPEASLALLLLAYVAGGWEASGRAFAAVRQATLDVDLLMLLAAAGAGVVGHWLEGAALLFLFSSETVWRTTRSAVRGAPSERSWSYDPTR